ncbi:MAG: DUF262 domain-containing protein [Ignavibacteria bacterium]
MKTTDLNKSEKLSFFQLFSEKNYIVEIPIIQRDYAQGRLPLKELRNHFLDSLYQYLEDGKNKDLDFVYGSLIFDNSNGNPKFVPLDGQQRLTTLFLIHWYLANKDNHIDHFRGFIKSDSSSKFTYETRSSSREFCDALVCKSGNLYDIYFAFNKCNNTLSEIIRDSAWYFYSWDNDPTISSMLVMLDAINDKFKSSNGFYQKLTDLQNPVITFQFLDLKNFNLTDDLYIKMNARGKLLTNFETFKAWLQKFIKISIPEFNYDNWEKKIDVEWTDILWKYKIGGSSKIDDDFYNYFKLMFLFSLIEAEDIVVEKAKIVDAEKQEIISELLDSEKIRFSTFEKIITETTLKSSFDFLSYFEKDGDNKILSLVNKIFPQDNFLCKIFRSSSSKVNYWDKTYIYSFKVFLINKKTKLIDYTDNDLEDLFKWMRVCKNLIYNTTIDSPGEFVNVLGQIEYLGKFYLSIYENLSSDTVKTTYISGPQMEEEKIKSGIILNDKTNSWQVEFLKYENHEYFNGQIGFLLDFCKNGGNFNFNLFKEYAEKVSVLFGDNILANSDFILERALLCKGDYLIRKKSNYSFCKSDKGTLRLREENWRRLLRDSQKIEYLKLLLNDITIGNEKEDLLRIINSYISDCNNNPSLKDWRYYFIVDKSVLGYCSDKQIRRDDDLNIKLLNKTQLNGYHAELFSYYFYSHYIKENLNNFVPLSRGSYFDVTGHEDPYIDLLFENNNKSYCINIYYKNSNFMVKIFEKDSKVVEPDIDALLLNINMTNNINDYSIELGNDTHLYNYLNLLCERIRTL